MSKPSMKILRDTDGHGYTIYDDMDVGDVIHKSEFWVRADRLHLLVSCASAALAEQNSRVMGGCKCDPATWDVTPTAICNSFVPEGPCPSVCANCEHDAACHSTHNTENQGE